MKKMLSCKTPVEIALTADTSKSISMQEAIAASERIWQHSIQTGMDKLILEEIDAEISAVLAER
jgi:hypothetical protein